MLTNLGKFPFAGDDRLEGIQLTVEAVVEHRRACALEGLSEHHAGDGVLAAKVPLLQASFEHAQGNLVDRSLRALRMMRELFSPRSPHDVVPGPAAILCGYSLSCLLALLADVGASIVVKMHPDDVLASLHRMQRRPFDLTHDVGVRVDKAESWILRGVFRIGDEGQELEALAGGNLAPGPLLRLHGGPAHLDVRWSCSWWRCWRWYLGSWQALGECSSFPSQLLSKFE
mmetsp:Transcript_9629/g.21144  ORF Transcript_9629/g.21144 Transcript_9629/m.21144 type:complete len:229 (-) Transcript_9629:590-1276(-)